MMAAETILALDGDRLYFGDEHRASGDVDRATLDGIISRYRAFQRRQGVDPLREIGVALHGWLTASWVERLTRRNSELTIRVPLAAQTWCAGRMARWRECPTLGAGHKHWAHSA